ncbi:DUF805 domain-containing protein [Kineococcus sp. SYSU DK018]|uniref:DUF805 domain-containing protein n=1 Tax=Kineococcus sp. SYSU DK018 TaxID=3383139 RepID=UPI003D7D643C
MSFSAAVSSVFRQYATFSGRARRSEYWWFQLALVLGYLALGLAGGLLSVLTGAVAGERGQAVLAPVLGLLLLVGALAVAVPAWAVAVRRLHDTGRSGWWVLLGQLPVVSTALFVFTLLDSAPGPNAHGPSPKAPRGGLAQPGRAAWGS